jgi:cytochrome c oxidase assembly protein subunit 15
VFLVRRRIPPGYAGALLGLFVLGGLQGALGWYMVKSGLVDDPRVSQFRLAGHLGLAFAIYGAMLWIALGLLAAAPEGRVAIPLRRLATALVAIVFVMVLSGALVAGIRAGFAYNTFPTMNGHLVPPEILMIENFGYNMATVQFDHRAIAWLLVILVPWAWVLSRRLDPPMSAARGWANALLAMLAVQFTLGVVTLLNGVPLAAAALHQAGAVLVFTCAIGMRHSLGDQRA